MRPNNAAARVSSGPRLEKENTESNRVAHLIVGDRTLIDGPTIVRSRNDAERVIAFIRECARGAQA